MSLLGSYRKKTGNDGYESLQLVDSNGDLSAGSSGAGGKHRVNAGAAARSPARQPPDRASTMDSSGSAARGERSAEPRARPPEPPSRPARGSPSPLAPASFEHQMRLPELSAFPGSLSRHSNYSLEKRCHLKNLKTLADMPAGCAAG
ncbi:hypothetical protein P7K49_016718 [Saguinus oedipus]|uniref:Uncharacterized protein n=1 Tax=Saguinus oedipus TaxID=9490 RepID=A0ABQ9VCV0_SAGOE|nr:hypothetical protein P7K49_016718 [Saguinus oedipus]